MLPGIAVLKSEEHWISHSVPGIKSQQTAVQSSRTADTTVLGCKATGIAVEKSKSHEKLQSKSPSASLTEQVSWHAPVLANTDDRWVKVALAFDVTVDVTMDLKVDVCVDVAGIFVDEA